MQGQKKVVVGKKIDNTIYAIYPKTTASIVEYNDSTVAEVLSAINATLRIVSFTLGKQSPQTAGTSVQLIVNAKGGTGELQYRFYRVGIGTTQVTVFRDWSTSNKTYCNPSAGKYIVYAEVRDTIGNIVTTQTLFEWTAQTDTQMAYESAEGQIEMQENYNSSTNEYTDNTIESEDSISESYTIENGEPNTISKNVINDINKLEELNDAESISQLE